jgi:type I restriction enzyme M protein
MVSKLSENGVAGFVLANGSMSTNTKGEGAIRQKLIENDLVDCMIALPGQLFYTTQIPVCLWFLRKSKGGSAQSPSSPALLPEGEGGKKLRSSDQAALPLGETGVRGNRDRRGETLFIDARKIGSMISRTQKELTAEDISKIAETYHAWRSGSNGAPAPLGDSQKNAAGAASLPGYQDIPGYCRSATISEIRKHDYVLTPGRYVGAAALEDDGIPFETKMTDLSQTLYAQMAESAKLDEVIRKNLEGLGYGK